MNFSRCTMHSTSLTGNIDYADGGSARNSNVLTWPIHTFNELFDDPSDNPDPDIFEFLGYYAEYLVVDKRGYEAIPKEYARQELGFPNNPHIRLNEEVCKIIHDDSGAIVITSQNKIYRAKKVITTINPTLYLTTNIFQPSLYPDPDDFPFQQGEYQMIYYQFKERFWPNREFINIVYPVDEVGRCGWFQNYNKRLTRNNFEAIYTNLTDDAPNVLDGTEGVDRFNWRGKRSFILKCLIATDAVAALPNGLTKKAIVEDFLAPLEKAFPDYKPPERIYVPKLWAGYNVGRFLVGVKRGVTGDYRRDQFEQIGSGSIAPSGTQKCERFAGWVHGAWEAGILSASECLSDLHPYIDVEIPDTCTPLVGPNSRMPDPRGDMDSAMEDEDVWDEDDDDDE